MSFRSESSSGWAGDESSSRETLGDSLGATLRAAAEGDELAWRRLVAHYAPRVYGLLRAQCGNAELAEEIAQSTFCTVAAKIGSYVEAGKFEAWLFRIAVNRLRDELRRKARHAAPTDDEVFQAMPSSVASARRGGGHIGGDPGGKPTGEEPLLRAALEQLSAADQRVVHLRHHAGLSFKQIAEALDEPLGTILARHHRALKKLRDLLAAAGFDPDDR